ncbi:MAG: hypothetical protein AB7E95_08860 [Kiritimatiellales bacterium]
MNDLIGSILDGLKDLATTAAADEVEAFMQDASEFLGNTKDDLLKWAKQLKDGKIDEQDFRDLLEMKKSVAEMHALKRKGMAKIRLEKLMDQMLDCIVGAVKGAV